VASRFAHRPVLLQESLAFLNLRPDSLIVDGTVGGGGHAAAILEQTAPNGRVIALDMDEAALEASARQLRPFGDRVELIHASFGQLARVLAERNVDGVDGVLLDLGVSSTQLDESDRGFRFAEAGAENTPLDMRMNRSADWTAADLLATTPADELARIFREYGDLPRARRLAREIVAARERAPLRTARDLLDVIKAAGVGRGRRHNPATLVFQALRIAVNDELGALAAGLGDAIQALRPGGRLVVLAYHSAEDRIVKHRMRDEARGCTCPPRTPVCICGGSVRLRVLTRRPVTPSAEEVAANPRARSAKLRAAERVAEAA
jgi:16S rRNA (cytosine1402-N4)-methyltransferase